MRFTSQTTGNGVTQRSFTLDGVPGVLWSPTAAAGTVPLVLLAHGGGQHSRFPGMVARAGRLVAGGFAVAAIDAPGHGDRPRTARHERSVTALREAMAAGRPVGDLVARFNAEIAEQAVPEWRATLDALREVDGLDGRVGFGGTSMGSMIGIPLVAAEPRIRAAVLGLVGHGSLAEAAARVTVPVEFLMQWDDEQIPRDAALALFDALGSREKTLHANPGGHGQVPEFETDSRVRFFARHLQQGG
jgi:pimeloyl-ACP methyl ester carboxylesterase